MAYHSPSPAQLNLKLKTDTFNPYVYVHLDSPTSIPHAQNQHHDFLPQIGPSCVSLSWIMASPLLCPPLFMNREMHSCTPLSQAPSLHQSWTCSRGMQPAAVGSPPTLPQGLTLLAFLYFPENSASFSGSSTFQPPQTLYLDPSLLLLHSLLG